MAPRRAAPSRTGTGREELSFLADLIGGEEVGSDAGSAAAKMNLNLFGEDDGDAAGGGGGGETQSQVRQPTHTGPSPTDLLRVLADYLLSDSDDHDRCGSHGDEPRSGRDGEHDGLAS